MGNKKNAWDNFEKSGKVADYIAYTAGIQGNNQFVSEQVKQEALREVLKTSVNVNLPPKEVDIHAAKNQGDSFKTT